MNKEGTKEPMLTTHKAGLYVEETRHSILMHHLVVCPLQESLLFFLDTPLNYSDVRTCHCAEYRRGDQFESGKMTGQVSFDVLRLKLRAGERGPGRAEVFTQVTTEQYGSVQPGAPGEDKLITAGYFLWSR